MSNITNSENASRKGVRTLTAALLGLTFLLGGTPIQAAEQTQAPAAPAKAPAAPAKAPAASAKAPAAPAKTAQTPAKTPAAPAKPAQTPAKTPAGTPPVAQAPAPAAQPPAAQPPAPAAAQPPAAQPPAPAVAQAPVPAVQGTPPDAPQGTAVAAQGTAALVEELTSVEEILRRMDGQLTFETRSATAKMIIVTPGETREKELKLFSRGQTDSFIIFLKPDRDKGSRFLKLEGQLWTYFPRTEKTVKLSGHMLRQSMMGSDFSYEDMAENKKVLDSYNGELKPSEKVDGEDAYVVYLKAKNQGVAYPEIRQWISKRTLLPLKEERYANTGKLLKVMRMVDVVKIGDRFYPQRVILEDKLKQGSRTELVLTDIKFGADVPQGIFDVRNLERTTNF